MECLNLSLNLDPFFRLRLLLFILPAQHFAYCILQSGPCTCVRVYGEHNLHVNRACLSEVSELVALPLEHLQPANPFHIGFLDCKF